MSIKSLLAICFCTFALIAASCGNDADNNGNNQDNNKTSLTLEAFEAQAPKSMSKLFCHGLFSCPEKQRTYVLMNAGRFASEEDCIANIHKGMWGDDMFAEQRDSLKAGRVKFDGVLAARCIATLHKLTEQCVGVDDSLNSAMDDCTAAFTPQLEKDAACGSHDECMSGNCAYSNDGTECFGRCGDAIAPGTEGQSCEERACQEGLDCQPNANGDYVCIKTVQGKKGDACDEDSGVLACEAGLMCTLQGVCDVLTLADAGQRCDMDQNLCKPGLTCTDFAFNTNDSSFSGTCASPGGKDAPCQTTFQCKIDFYCDGSFEKTGKCLTSKKQGETCEDSEECADFMDCDDNICIPYGLGAVCDIPAN